MGQLTSLNLRSFAHRLPNGESEDSTLPVAALITPFAGDRPCGESLLYEGTYDRIRQARSEDDASLPQGIWETAVRVGDWKDVRQLTIQALERDSKDLQIAIWLCEALARRHGFTGFAQGLEVVQTLCATLWPHLHPEIEDGDADGRLNAFSWLNETLSRSIARLPVALPDEAPALSLADFQAALPERTPVSDLPKEGGRLIPNGLHITTALAETPADQLQRVHSATVRSLAAIRAIEAQMAEVLDPREQPGFGKMIAVLDACRDKTARQLAQRGIPLDSDTLRTGAQTVTESTAALTDPSSPRPTTAEEAAAMTETTDSPPDTATSTGPGGPLRSRADAYRLLAEAADYLARTEPHSPVPYLVRRAIRWGTMPLQDLLSELVEDTQDRSRIQDLLGMGGDR